MPRRASSSVNPLWIFAAFFLVAGFSVGGYWIYSQLNDPFRALSAFPADAYLANSDSLRGNVYRLDGTIANQLGWAPETGRLYSLEMADSENVLAIMVPAKFNAVNLQKGQRFEMEVKVEDKGLLTVRNLRKA